MKEKLNSKKIAFSLAIVSAILYVICAIFVILAPVVVTNLFSNIFHGIDITKIIDVSISFESILIGLVEIVIYALIVGWLFGIVYNKIK